MAAHDGDLVLGDFHSSALRRTEVMAFLSRVTMVLDPEQPADMPSTKESWSRTIIVINDGRRFSRKIVDPKGYPANPLSEEELQRKFADCARGQPESVLATYSLWRNASKQPSVRAMCIPMRRLQPAGRVNATG